ncbi:MAG TPA: S9 family peptidase [Blastocatellia bacterium]|nr:S9 family peptidase [Blastocatellia bacterium]
MRRLLKIAPSTLIVLAIYSSAFGQDKTLTVDTIYDPANAVNFNGSHPRGLRWLKDPEHYIESVKDPSTGDSHVVEVDARTGQSRSYFDPSKMLSALTAIPGITREEASHLAHGSDFEYSPAEDGVLINYANDLFYYKLGAEHIVRLTNDPFPEVGEQFSPDGKMVSFVRKNNLYVVDLATRTERAITTDGGPKILNGRLDWVYQEEVYGRGHFEGYWWSPDSTKLAFLRLDEHPVSEFTIVDDIPYDQNLEVTLYPRAGDPNPRVELRIADVVGGKTEWVNTYKYGPDDLLIVRVAWTPEGNRLVYQAQNREQTWLDLNFVDPADGQSQNVIHETSKAWVEVIDNPYWLKDGSFLWLSERSGFRHIYHYDANGRLIRQVTDGNWEARSLDGVDQQRGLVYFSGTEHSPIGIDVYRIQLDGTGLTRISKTDGTHLAQFNSSSTMFIDRASDVNTPPQVRLYDVDGNVVRTIDDNEVPALKDYKLGKVEFLQVKTRDGFVMEAEMIKPPDFDPTKKYPVLSYTYSGPHAQTVRNGWGGPTFMWHQMLAERGYIIWMCDNRTASGKGVVSTWPVFHNFGELELRDLEDGVSWLKSQPYVDGSRIGLWGWSFGGFMTTYALTHSTSFKIGIAGGTVADWRDYDSIYTERYMGLPQKNPEGYKNSSVRAAAKNLSGKLLLIHGAIDDNVHEQNTIQLIYALQNAGKEFQMMLYPRSRHGVTDPALVKHLHQMMTDFVLRNL